jgi:hypothetical protein
MMRAQLVGMVQPGRRHVLRESLDGLAMDGGNALSKGRHYPNKSPLACTVS